MLQSPLQGCNHRLGWCIDAANRCNGRLELCNEGPNRFRGPFGRRNHVAMRRFGRPPRPLPARPLPRPASPLSAGFWPANSKPSNNMNNSQQNKLAMYRITVSACARFIAQGTHQTSKGQTRAKTRTKRELATATYAMAQALTSFANSTGNAALAASMGGSRTAFARLRDGDLPARAWAVHATATANLPALAANAVTTADLADFGQKIEAFDRLLTAPQDVKVENSAAAQRLEATFDKIAPCWRPSSTRPWKRLCRKPRTSWPNTGWRGGSPTMPRPTPAPSQPRRPRSKRTSVPPLPAPHRRAPEVHGLSKP